MEFSPAELKKGEDAAPTDKITSQSFLAKYSSQPWLWMTTDVGFGPRSLNTTPTLGYSSALVIARASIARQDAVYE